jgi:hypothetical protein
MFAAQTTHRWAFVPGKHDIKQKQVKWATASHLRSSDAEAPLTGWVIYNTNRHRRICWSPLPAGEKRGKPGFIGKLGRQPLSR